MALVYLLTNLENGKLYVGKTKGGLAQRWYNHVKDAAGGSPYAIHRAIRKYGKELFSREVLAEYAAEEEALLGEKEWIAKHDSMQPRGYNLCEGGRGSTGFRHSAEARAKMSASAIAEGRSLSPLAMRRSLEVRQAGLSTEARAHMAWAQKVRRAEEPEELRRSVMQKAIAASIDARRGTPLPEEHRAKMSSAQIARRASEAPGHRAEQARKMREWHARNLASGDPARIAASRPPSRRLVGPPTCNACGVPQTGANTAPRPRRSSGLHFRCRECDRAYLRAWATRSKATATI